MQHMLKRGIAHFPNYKLNKEKKIGVVLKIKCLPVILYFEIFDLRI